MATTATKNQKNQSKSTAAKRTTKQTASKAQQQPAPQETVSVRDRAFQAAETAVDVPVGTALTVYERVNDVVEPYSTPSRREAEIRRVRAQLRRELNKVERRGGTARRRAIRRAKQTRNRLEREVRQQRRTVESTVRKNRRKAEQRLKRAERQLKDNRDEAGKRVRQVVDRVQGSDTQAA